MIGILILRLAVVASNPVPLCLERLDRGYRSLPQCEVLDRSAFSLPPSRHPARNPGSHSFDNVPRVAREYDADGPIHLRELAKGLDHGVKRHPVIGRCGLRYPVVPAHEVPALEHLDDATSSSGVRPFASVSKTRFISVDSDDLRLTHSRLAHSTGTTSMRSISSR